jgi:tetratricopeptide (TPR) repeat protein
MSYQLPPLIDEDQFERLIRDILRRVYDDRGIERFGRRGQAQCGIDGFSPANSGVTFQCKLKEIMYKSEDHLRNTLLTQMEEELKKTKGLKNQPKRFIFATTFKNDSHLQQKATSLSGDSITVEYWGWDTINEKIWEYAEVLIPIYYPLCPVRQIPGFRQVTLDLIKRAQTNDVDELNKLALEYYRINDRDEVVFKVVCNDIDVRNDWVMSNAFDRLDALPPSGTLWVLGAGGCGKTTILHRLALELARRKQNVYTLNLETKPGKDDLESILSLLKYSSTSEQTVLCIDNPAADEETLEALLRRVPDYCSRIHILLAERAHRYKTLQGTGCLTYLHGEEGLDPIIVRNTRRQRQKVYGKLFDLLGVPDVDAAQLQGIIINERLVYVNATYSILLELKRKRKIVFDFDWDDYRKSTDDLPAFTEGYKYIALFYLFGVRTPFSVLSKVFGANEAQQRAFLERFRGLVNEPVIVDEKRDDSFRKYIYVRTKHEIVSEIFFREHPALDKTELLMEWCEHTDFEDAIESQALINIFGAKKNYSVENTYIDFKKLIDFLLNGYVSERIEPSSKLSGTLHLAEFWLLLSQDKSTEAITALRSFLESAPENLHCRTELAKIYQRQGKLKEAEAVLLELLGLDKANLQARTELAKIYQKQGKLKEAEAVLLKVLEIKASDINSRTELARIYQRQGKLKEAEAVLLKVLDIKPDDLNSRTELGKVYQKQNELDKAEAVLRKLLEIDTDNRQARTELAKIYQRQNKLGEAQAVLLSVLEVKPKDLNSRTELAKIYQKQGKLKEAEAVLMESLVIDAEQLHPRTELAKIYQRQGKLKEAEAVLMESLVIDAEQLHPRTELAKIYQRQGKLNEAEKRAEEVLAIDPLNDHAISELLAIWKRQGEKEKCAKRFLEFIAQPNYRFSRFSQAPVYRFFQCCKAFNMKENADIIFQRFESELDNQNRNYYAANFT